MSLLDSSYIARARADSEARLIEADELVAGLQQRCGGEIGGRIAVPELLALVRKGLAYGLRLSREIAASDGDDRITAWVEVVPHREGEDVVCDIGIVSWHSDSLPHENETEIARLQAEIDCQLAELSARLGPNQNVLSVQSDAADLAELRERMELGIGRPWTDFVEFPQIAHRQPVHWRLLDGARCLVAGSQRHWRATLVPLGQPEAGRSGFELYLTADTPLDDRQSSANELSGGTAPTLGHDIASVLREPIARIIGNAETIRSRLAGPLADEYSNYAGDISEAANHLLGLVDDLADLEAVEAVNFVTAPDAIDLADAARRASAMLGGRAQEKRIAIIVPGEGANQPAVGEFRRVMQVLLNLVSNAIRYAPEGRPIEISLGKSGNFAQITVADEGPGLSPEQQHLVFEKFERLGRSGDGGSGLGLYISRRIARAMGGDISIESAPGKGARFTLSIPAGK